MPSSEQAIGMSISEPPGTPEAPAAPSVARKQRMSAFRGCTGTCRVCAAASERTAMVMAAPAMLMFAPSGMLML